MKKGRISKQEEAYIKANYTNSTPEFIALELDRDPESVKQFIKRKYRVNITNEEEAAFDLEARPYWNDLKEQFTEDELRLFKYHWSRIVSQFDSNVTPTEEFQIIDLIKLEILMNRCLKGNKDNIEQIHVLEALIQAERQRDIDQQDRDMLFNMERQAASLKASQESLNKDYRELQSKKGSMLKDMKATREQRVKRIEESKQSLTGWIAYLMTNPELTKQYGIEMEKMRLAMEKEKQRLGEYHTYTDGQIDQPFLNSDTVRD